MERITATQAEGYIPLKQNYSDTSVSAANYFTRVLEFIIDKVKGGIGFMFYQTQLNRVSLK